MFNEEAILVKGELWQTFDCGTLRISESAYSGDPSIVLIVLVLQISPPGRAVSLR
jgi:hypothetical protein